MLPMSRISKLEGKVRALYEQKLPTRGNWADYLWSNHVLVVAEFASNLAKKYEVDEDLARAAALLHDIADATMPRENPEHEQESLKIARDIMTELDYTEDDMKIVIDDALVHHSCHDDDRPATQVGKILATADALAHLKTDFYILGVWLAGTEKDSYEKRKEWVTTKIERDYHNKILFEDEKLDTKHDYEIIKELFSR